MIGEEADKIASSAREGQTSDFSGSGKAIAGSAGLTLTGAVLGASLAMVNEILAARFLGTQTYGCFGIALMLAKIGEIIALFGLPLGLLHFLPAHLALSEPRLALGAILGGLLLPLTIGLFLTALGVIGHGWISSHLFKLPQAGEYIAILACAIPLTATAEMLGSIARGFGRFLPYIVIRNLVPPLCYMAALIYLSANSGLKIDAAYGYVAAASTGATLGLFWVLRLIHIKIGFIPAFRLGALYRFSGPIALNSLVTIVFLWVDLFLLATLTNAKTVGIYRGCTQVLLTFDLVLTACSAAAAPIYAVMLSRDQRHRMQETLTIATRITTILATTLFFVILINPRDLLGLLGRDFEAGYLALSILALGQFIKVMFGSASIAMIIGGKQRIEVINTAFSAFLNLALNLLSIPRLGLLGAAISTTLSMLMLSILRAVQLWFVLRLRIIDRMLGRILLVATPVAALVWATENALRLGQGTGFIDLALRAVATGLLIVSGIGLFCFKKEDRSAALSAILRYGKPSSAH